MQKQARNTSDLKRKKDGPAAAMLSTGLSAWPRDLRILQNKKTRRRQHGTVVWGGVDAALRRNDPQSPTLNSLRGRDDPHPEGCAAEVVAEPECVAFPRG